MIQRLLSPSPPRSLEHPESGKTCHPVRRPPADVEAPEAREAASRGRSRSRRRGVQPCTPRRSPEAASAAHSRATDAIASAAQQPRRGVGAPEAREDDDEPLVYRPNPLHPGWWQEVDGLTERDGFTEREVMLARPGGPMRPGHEATRPGHEGTRVTRVTRSLKDWKDRTKKLNLENRGLAERDWWQSAGWSDAGARWSDADGAGTSAPTGAHWSDADGGWQ